MSTPPYGDRVCGECQKLIGYSRYPIHTLCFECARPVDKRKGERLYCKACSKWFGISLYPIPRNLDDLCDECG